MTMTLHDLLIDKRIVQRNIEQGKLEPAEYQRILNALPDLSDKVWRRPAPADPVSSANMPAANMPAANMPAANMPAANMPAAHNAPESGPASANAPRADAASVLLETAPALPAQPTALPG